MRTGYAIAMAVLAGVAGAVTVQTLHGQAKPPAFYVAEIDVTNIDAYTKEYSSKAVAFAKSSGAKFLAAGQNAVTIEGDPPRSRVVISQWENMDKLNAWRNSAEYKANREIGNKYGKFRAWAIEGAAQ